MQMEESPVPEVESGFAAVVEVAGAQRLERVVAAILERELQDVEIELALYQRGT